MVICNSKEQIKNYQILMYNCHLAQKLRYQKDKSKIKQKKIKGWIKRYYHQVQPTLLENYDKRINTFIRKMEENPIKLQIQSLQTSNLNKLFRNVYQKDSFIANQSFKFRDKEDWKSLLTPMERVQRKNNAKLFEQKFGSSQFAFRSIGSQSEYKSTSKNQFRIREKVKQINPPMRYTYKQVQSNTLLQKAKKIIKKEQKVKEEDQRSQLSSGNAFRKRSITNNSGTNFGQDDLKSQLQSMRHSNPAEADEELYAIRDLQNQKDDNKLHFKKMIDLQQSVIDQKTKKGLKQLLIKCRVYRTKDKRCFTQQQTDHFDQEAHL